MKSIGIIRRIDDLGRIVIPKEIRRTLKINDGDNLEIYIADDTIILKKYSFLNNIFSLSKKILDVFYKIYHKNILITDTEKIVVATKNIGNEYINKHLSSDIINIINNRIEVERKISIMNNDITYNIYLLPIISSSDVLGSIILIDDMIDEQDKTLIKLINAILVKNIEE